MTLALAYLAGMASMAVVLFLRGAREVSECQAHHEEVERLKRTIEQYATVLERETGGILFNGVLLKVDKTGAIPPNTIVTINPRWDDSLDRLPGWSGALK